MLIFLIFSLIFVTNANTIKLFGNIDSPDRPVSTFSFDIKKDFVKSRVRRETSDVVVDAVKLKVNYIDFNNKVTVNWLGGDNSVIICQTRNTTFSSAVYISHDDGDTFENKTDDFKLENGNYAPLEKFYAHPLYNTHFIFTSSEENLMYVTDDMGNNFKRLQLTFTPSEVSFHKSEASIFVILDKSGSNQKLWITNNFGGSFRLLYECVRSFFWARDTNKTDHLLVLSYANNASAIFITDPSKMNESRIFKKNVEDFFVKNDHVFFTAKNDKQKTNLYVSYKLGKQQVCKFNTIEPIKGYYILDINNGKALVALAHSNSDARLYLSENFNESAKKIKFKLSLEKIFLYLPYITWFEIIKQPKDPFVDIHKVEGADGVYVASKIVELDTIWKYHKGIQWKITTIKHLASVITFDYGSVWRPIQPPTLDLDGKPTSCRPKNNCSLHFSSAYTRSYSELNRPTERIISSKSAPGMILATGSIGSHLKDPCKVYLSLDAGLTWRQILDDSFFFGFGDHGGIMTLLRHDESRDWYPDKFGSTMYSIDDGKSWKTMPFSFRELYGLMVEPGEKGTTFLTFGVFRDQGVIIKMDFSRVGDNCGLEYFEWSPLQSEQRYIPCVSNERTVYQKRISAASCLKGQEYVQLTRTEKCECTIDNIQCDTGFKLTNNPVGCIFDKNSISTDPFEVPSDCQPRHSYLRTRGYRRITNQVCRTDFFVPERIPCPPKKEDDFMLLVQEGKISRYNLKTKSLEPLSIGNVSDSIDVDFDEIANCVYWTEWVEHSIKRYCLGMKNQPDVLVSGVWVQRIELDWLTRNLYFLDSKNKSIQLIQVDSSIEKRKQFTILDDLGDVYSFVLHPKRGYIFWIDRSRAQLLRANMDGTGVITLFENNQIGRSRAITIDYIADRIYWVEHEKVYIGSSDLQGRNLHKIHLDIGYAPLKIVAFKHKLYWTNSQRDGVSAAAKDDLVGVETIVDELDSLGDLKVFGYGIKSGTNPCAKSKCLDACVAMPGNKFACVYRTGCWDTAFFCKDGGCVPQRQRCDNSVDCYDGSDETDCNEDSCTSNEFPCNNGKCIFPDWRCDRLDNCGDYTDEVHCPTYFGSCKSDQFACRSGSLKCIPSTQLCDGEKNCEDGSDEVGCTIPRCPHGKFKCDVLAETCIDYKWVCDRQADCPNKKDEENCTISY